MGVAFYKRAGAAGEQAACAPCGDAFGSRLHVDDLKRVQAALGIRYQMMNGAHYQDVCPACRRKTLAIAQDAVWREAGGHNRGGGRLDG
jgi:hypothetical protein